MNAGYDSFLFNAVTGDNGSTIVDASEMVKNYILISGVPFKVYSGSIIAVNVYAALAQFKIGGFDIITVCNDLLVAR